MYPALYLRRFVSASVILLGILLPFSNFQYRITGLDWFDIMRVCNNIQVSNCSHYTNISSLFLLSYTQPDVCWFIVETSAYSCGLYSCSNNLCSSGKVFFLKLNSVFFYATQNCTWICELIHTPAVRYCPHSCERNVQIKKDNQRSARCLFVGSVNTDNTGEQTTCKQN